MSQFIEMFGDTHMRSDHSRQWKEVVEIINGKDYKSIQVEDGGYPVYGTGGEMARASDYLSPANSILLGRKGTIDKPLLIREKYWNVDTAFGAVPDEKVLHYVYFYWHCKTIDFNVLNKGTTLPSTTKVDLLNLWIKIPSMEEQTRFGSIVEQADKSKFGDFKSQFIEMFGTVENNTHNFPIMTIGEFAYCFAGATPSTSHPEYWENGRIRWMSSGEVHKGHVEDTDSRITELGYKSASTRMVPIHSIVIAIAGQGKTRGTVAITEVDLCTNQSLCAIVPDERVNYSYLYHNLQGRYLELRGLSGDVNGRGGLNLKIIQKIPVILPPIEKQQQFASIAQQADKSKSVIQKALVYLNDIQSDELKEIA
ncbi:restriction endonuclease subunit S [Bacteroides ovatus]|uniref:restriction endonuclease subunit S n=1 Tax=Bacteroides ovatus TaxID=28116 RepID=UPI001F4333F9|nr:restriction endonuclease subunit S [Bacteroides ovatus]MCE9172807.1 restriction endonuclease subunit S [Bacteroides ovatus]